MATEERASTVRRLIDGGVLDKQMRQPKVERSVLGQPVLASDGQPNAVVVRKPCGTVGVVDRSLVVNEAHLDRPSIIVAIRCTGTDSPGIFEVSGVVLSVVPLSRVTTSCLIFDHPVHVTSPSSVHFGSNLCCRA